MQNHDAMRGMVDFSPQTLELIERSQTGKDPCVIAGLHLSNFDLAMQVAYLSGLKALAITLPELQGGYQWQFEMRKRIGMEIIPASMSAVREAVERVRSGSMVLTGLDRPLAETRYQPLFFGKPSHVPVHHILIALKAGAPIVIGAAMTQSDGRYIFDVSSPIQMRPYPDRKVEILRNAEAVLEVAEDLISKQPQEWAMFIPVWPDPGQLSNS
jgi:KDO2-lipid IV(A) lauroyltransferase